MKRIHTLIGVGALVLLCPLIANAMKIGGVEPMDKTQEAQGVFDPGSWGVLPGMSESVFSPGGFGIDGESGDPTHGVFSPGGFGVFMPGGWGLEGIETETFSGEPPGRVSLWWRGIKENVSLAFTFDPIEKNKKRLKFAEERMGIANSYAKNVQGPNDTKRIEESVRRAHSMMEKIGEDSDKWLKPGNKDSQQLLGNMMRHQLNRENALDFIEGRLHDNNLTGIREMRQKGLKISQRLLGEVESHELPEPVKQHVDGLKKQFAGYENEVGKFRTERQKMIQLKVNGDGEAALRLNQMEKQRRARVRNREVMQLRVQRLPKGQVPQDLPPGVQLHEWKAQQFHGGGSAEEPPMETISGTGQVEEPPMETFGGTGQSEIPPVEE